jgi:hypothetical protein
MRIVVPLQNIYLGRPCKKPENFTRLFEGDEN